jgi:hypothetical protein
MKEPKKDDMLSPLMYLDGVHTTPSGKQWVAIVSAVKVENTLLL